MTVDLSKLENSVEVIIEALKSLEAEKAAIYTSISTLNKQKNSLQKEIKELNKKKSVSENEIKQLEHKLKSIKEGIDSEKVAINDLLNDKEKKFMEKWDNKFRELGKKEKEIIERIRNEQDNTIKTLEETIRIKWAEVKLRENTLDKRESVLNFKIGQLKKKEFEIQQKAVILEDQKKLFKI